MKWFPSDAVQYLEAAYDSMQWGYVWEYDDPMSYGMQRTYVREPTNEGDEWHNYDDPWRVVGRSYSQPMFIIKPDYDVNEEGPAVDIDGEWDRCGRCVQGLPHPCPQCATTITHMAFLCPACHDALGRTEEQPVVALGSAARVTAEELTRYAQLPGIRALAAVHDSLMRDGVAGAALEFSDGMQQLTTTTGETAESVRRLQDALYAQGITPTE